MPSQLFMFEWTGEAMAPVRGFQKRCDETFYVGERYRMEVQEERSMRSHRHYFAAVHDAWMNLPEDKADRFPTSEHLRKWALIRSGYCDMQHIVLSTQDDAREVAKAMRRLSAYAVITVSATVITVYTARSQSVKLMGKKDFGKSKTAVLDVLAGLVGTSAGALATNATQVA